MRIKDIKVGQWYRTKAGIGVAVEVGGRWPPSVELTICFPFPLRRVLLSPREVYEPVDAPGVDARHSESEGGDE